MTKTSTANPEQAIAEKLTELQTFIRDAAAREPTNYARASTLNLIAVLLRQPIEVVNRLMKDRVTH